MHGAQWQELIDALTRIAEAQETQVRQIDEVLQHTRRRLEMETQTWLERHLNDAMQIASMRAMVAKWDAEQNKGPVA